MVERLSLNRVTVTAATHAFAEAGAQVVATDAKLTTLAVLAGSKTAVRLTATYTTGQIHVIEGGWTS